MSTMKAMVPMDDGFCTDMIRFSDGRITLSRLGELAEEQVLSLLERSFEDHGEDWFGDRAVEFAEIYFPHIAEDWRRADAAAAVPRYPKRNKPLVWKEVTIEHGAQVRMHYAGVHHYAIVEDGRIVDEDGKFSPSEWASKVAGGTTRNAWRDLSFKELLSSHWLPAQFLRDQARSEKSRGMQS